MDVNVGAIDRVLRILVGVGLIVWAFAFAGPVWAYIGVVPLVTGVLSRCPAYAIFGINSCKK
ncbi:MAG: DUF2892 domain-containing protein [Methylophilaceae bacterium]|nr:DUF2892 domain-containing protein [Methylophilaceae bacterium]